MKNRMDTDLHGIVCANISGLKVCFDAFLTPELNEDL